MYEPNLDTVENWSRERLENEFLNTLDRLKTCIEVNSDEPRVESGQDSSPEVDLPVAATVHRQYPNGDVRFHSIVENMVEEGDDLTPVRCAEDAVKEARQQERQEIPERIKNKVSVLKSRRASKSGSSYIITALENLVGELRDGLENSEEI